MEKNFEKSVLILFLIIGIAFAEKGLAVITSSTTEIVQGRGVPTASSLVLSSTGGEKVIAGVDTLTLSYVFNDPDRDDDFSMISWFIVDGSARNEVTTAKNKKSVMLDPTLVVGKASPVVEVCLTPASDAVKTLPHTGTALSCLKKTIARMNNFSFSTPTNLNSNPTVITGAGEWQFGYGPNKGTKISHICNLSEHQNTGYILTYGSGKTRQASSTSCLNADYNNSERGAVFLSADRDPNVFYLKSGNIGVFSDDYPNFSFTLNSATPARKYMLSLSVEHEKVFNNSAVNNKIEIRANGNLISTLTPQYKNRKTEVVGVELSSGQYLSIILTGGPSKADSDHYVKLSATGYEIML